MQKIVSSLSIIALGLTLGYIVQILATRGIFRLPSDLQGLRRLLQKAALLVLNPVAFLGAAWSASLTPRLVWLPLIGLAALAAGLFLGRCGAALLKLPREKGSVFATAGSFTNTGSIGGLVVFVFLGEAAFAYVAIYKLFEDLWNYGVLFPLVRSGGRRIQPGMRASCDCGGILSSWRPWPALAAVWR